MFEKNNKELQFTEPSKNVNELTSGNLEIILGINSDVKIRKLIINEKTNIQITMIYVDGLANQAFISDYILKPLYNNEKLNNAQDSKELIKLIDEGNIYISSQLKLYDINKTLDEILSGGTALIFDDCKTSIIFDTKGFEKRAISEPSVENITKAAKDSFVETIRVNTSIIRRKIKTANLVIENLVVGRQTITNVAIVYIKGLTNTNIVDEVRNRLNAINIDSAIGTVNIEEFICDDVNCVFPQIANTERPDKFCNDIIEGRVGIIVDNLPIGYIVPGTLVQFLQAPEDYGRNYIFGSFIRFMRYCLLGFTLIFPGFFVAVLYYHQEMIPTRLILAISKAHTGVVFPMVIEIIYILISFEILYEASLRIPRTIGQAISIIGTLVIGQAAVDAKIISPITVLIVATVSIASLVMPNQDVSNALRLWRFIFVIFGGILGLYGINIALILFIFKMAKLESFGVPYLSPIVSGDDQKLLEDTLFRFPMKFQKTRPKNINPLDIKRQG